ncbi:hypothetical protein WME79_33850 [Sorangium sp. So ce726]|uniref:hypothetical protein n=1 Tax=Sorangium sp. So ce726 TaxID=3133319 RepID=UPI003F5FC0E9
MPDNNKPQMIRFHVDVDQLHGLLDQQPRVEVASRVGGKAFTLIEATRTKNPGNLAVDDIIVNVLC